MIVVARLPVPYNEELHMPLSAPAGYFVRYQHVVPRDWARNLYERLYRRFLSILTIHSSDIRHYSCKGSQSNYKRLAPSRVAISLK